MWWNKRYDGTWDSLSDWSHRPYRAHPSSHTYEEITWIKNLHRRNPKISVCQMDGKWQLREEAGILIPRFYTDGISKDSGICQTEIQTFESL